jgi:hypothetical protein
MVDQEQLANLRLAYQEVCKSYQAIVDFRAKLLGFLPLASGAGAYAVLSKEPMPNWAWVAGLGLGGGRVWLRHHARPVLV